MRVTDRLLKLLGLAIVAGVLVSGMMFPAVGGIGLLSNKITDSVNSVSAEMAQVDPPLMTTVVDSAGNQVATLYQDQYRIPATFDQINVSMRAAIIAVEDKRFYQHAAVDLKGTVRALANNSSGGSSQGGSTITQQYVKNYMLNVVDRTDKIAQQQDKAQTPARKIREARIAMQLEQVMSKDAILTGYLNVVSFNARVFGVGAAAKAFFDTSSDKLTIPQAALLAAVVNNPIVYDPWRKPENALKRRNIVIDLMYENGSITKDAATAAKATPLGVYNGGPNLPSSNCYGASEDAGFFCDYAMTYLEEAGFTKDQILNGGWTIKLTMDPNAQKTAKANINQNVSPTEDGVANPMAIIKAGTTSHDILAMVSSRGFGLDNSKGEISTNQVADVSVGFGAGSIFKTFVSASALEQGIAGVNTTLSNPQSICLMPPVTNKYTPCSTVSNLGHTPDPIPLWQALQKSPNTAFEQLIIQDGIQNALNMAYRLGMRNTMTSIHATPARVTTNLDDQMLHTFWNSPSFTLGVLPTSPLELANVTATLYSGGTWCKPNPIASITDRYGKAITVPTQPCEQAVGADTANSLLNGMSHDDVGGTSASAATAAGWTRPISAKTGTTNSNYSVGFLAGVPGYGLASLVYADGRSPAAICANPVRLQTNANCKGAFGGSAAAPPAFRTLIQILGNSPVQSVPNIASGYDVANNHGTTVPFVFQKNVVDATKALQDAGYKVVTKETSSDRKADLVVAQSIYGTAPQNTEVTIYVSTGTLTNPLTN